MKNQTVTINRTNGKRIETINQTPLKKGLKTMKKQINQVIEKTGENKPEKFENPLIEKYFKAMEYAKKRETIEINDIEDVLQESIIDLLFEQAINPADKTPVEIEKIFNGSKKRNRINLYKKYSGKSISNRDQKIETCFQEFENLTEDSVFDQTEKTGFNDTVEYIKEKLTADQWTLFDLYYLQDKTIKEIMTAKKITYFEAQKMIKALTNRLHRLKITELYEPKFLISGGSVKGKYTDKTPIDKALQWIDKKELIDGYKVKESGFYPIVNDNEYAKNLKIKIELKRNRNIFNGMSETPKTIEKFKPFWNLKPLRKFEIEKKIMVKGIEKTIYIFKTENGFIENILEYMIKNTGYTEKPYDMEVNQAVSVFYNQYRYDAGVFNPSCMAVNTGLAMAFTQNESNLIG